MLFGLWNIAQTFQCFVDQALHTCPALFYAYLCSWWHHPPPTFAPLTTSHAPKEGTRVTCSGCCVHWLDWLTFVLVHLFTGGEQCSGVPDGILHRHHASDVPASWSQIFSGLVCLNYCLLSFRACTYLCYCSHWVDWLSMDLSNINLQYHHNNQDWWAYRNVAVPFCLQRTHQPYLQSTSLSYTANARWLSVHPLALVVAQGLNEFCHYELTLVEVVLQHDSSM